jgi:DNA (cytosine-5)-methyltransferase 1
VINGLDLFSGIGGITIALGPWVQPVAYCENERFAQAVLLQRMVSGELPHAPIWDDVRTLNGTMLPGIDIIYGGFPCQDISVAGTGKGLEGSRSGLVYEIFRLARETKPSFIFLENVPAIRTRGGERVGKELAAIGYDCRWHPLSASDVGANHLRKRWFLLAHAKGERRGEGRPESTGLKGGFGATERGQTLADPNSAGLEIGEPWDARQCSSPFGKSWWEFEPNVGRVAHGVHNRVDRIRALGNSVVPAQARQAFKRLMGLEDRKDT